MSRKFKFNPNAKEFVSQETNKPIEKWTNISPTVLLSIASFLDYQSLAIIESISSGWNKSIVSKQDIYNKLWKKLYLKYFLEYSLYNSCISSPSFKICVQRHVYLSKFWDKNLKGNVNWETLNHECNDKCYVFWKNRLILLGKSLDDIKALPIPVNGPKTTGNIQSSDEKDVVWRLLLKEGDRIDAKDIEGLWYKGFIYKVKLDKNKDKWFLVTFDEWNGNKYNEWYHQMSPFIAPFLSKSESRISYQYDLISVEIDMNCISLQPPVIMVSERPGIIDHVVVPNESSLFNSISYACENRIQVNMLRREKAHRLRIYETVINNEKFSYLKNGMTNDEFKLCVLNTDKPEKEEYLHALAEFFGINIRVFDIIEGKMRTYAYKNATNQIFLLKDSKDEKANFNCIVYKYYVDNGDKLHIQEYFNANDKMAVSWTRTKYLSKR